jgi:hypothetical protein
VSQWKEVTEAKEAEAEIQLQSTGFVQLTSQQAQNLIGGSNFPEGDGLPYLLRAAGDARHKFPLEPSVRSNGDVWIGGGANSKCSVEMKRRPVVAWLNRAPREVYVTFFVSTD